GADYRRAPDPTPGALRLRPDPVRAQPGTDDVEHATTDRLTDMNPLPYGTDQLIDATMARALHADACRTHAAVAWVVLWDPPAYPERYAARRKPRTSSRLVRFHCAARPAS